MNMKKGLGRGLDSLIPDIQREDTQETTPSSSGKKPIVTMIPIHMIEPNPDQPRHTFGAEALGELTASIKLYGVLQPIVVRPSKTAADRELYEIVAGERRWRAARQAELVEIPVILKKYDEKDTLFVSVIENVQRADLNVVEEALAYKQMSERYSLTQEEIGAIVGKDRATIANTMRLLSLPKRILLMAEEGKLSAGQAKALLATKNVAIQNAIADKILAEGLNVRQTEAAVKRAEAASNDVDKKQKRLLPNANQIHYTRVKNELEQILGTKVNVVNAARKGKAKGKIQGKIEIAYVSDDDLNRILEIVKMKGE